MTATIQRSKTAMSRTFVSRPVGLALEDGILRRGRSFFDYGCGRGGDVRRMHALGLDAAGWDPAYSPNSPCKAADVVNLGYVVNVIEDPLERAEALRLAWQLAKDVLVVAARLRWEESSVRGREHADGLVTSKNTFQKFFTQEELRAWIDSSLGQTSVAAAPGVFYVFRSSEARQSLLAQRSRSTTASGIRVADVLYDSHRHLLEPLQAFVQEHRRLPRSEEFLPFSEVERELGSVAAAFSLIRRVTGPSQWADVSAPARRSTSSSKYAAHRNVLEPLVEFLSARGRLPRAEELENVADVREIFGSVRAAFALIRRVFGANQWALVEEARRRDFLVYLALAAFSGRPKFAGLPQDLQFDVKDFFGTFTEATRQADQLLFAVGKLETIDLECRTSQVGKLTPEALYVHVSAIGELSPLLRVYDGCARALTGTVDDATILKLNRLKPQVSYLAYPDFDTDPHPSLTTVVIGRLQSLDVTFRDFRRSENPPILHRKETFVSNSYDGKAKFERLTRREERAGLLDNPASIGTVDGWTARLVDCGYTLRGHTLRRT